MTNSSKFQSVFLETKNVSRWFNRGSVACPISSLAHQAMATWNLNLQCPFMKTYILNYL